MTPSGLPRWLEWIELRAAELSALAMLVMVFCVTVDVFMRYTLHAPLTWSYDLVTMYLMPAVVFLPMAVVQRSGHHINVDILHRRMAPGLQRFGSVVGLLGAGAVVAIFAGLAGKRAWLAFIGQEVISGPIPWPTWVGPAILAAGAALFVIRAVANAGLSLMHRGHSVTSVEPVGGTS